MKGLKEIDIIIAEIDLYLIEKIRKIRIGQNPRISQVTLSQMLGLADGFVGKVENMKESAKYNLWHINKIIKVLNLKSVATLFPPEATQNDIVRVRLQFKKTSGIDEKSYKILSMKSLSENEMELFKKNKLPYLTKVK